MSVEHGLPTVGVCVACATPPVDNPCTAALRTAADSLISDRIVFKRAEPPLSPGSYGVKHKVERFGKQAGLEPYVSNGALIQAALDLGIRVRPHGMNSPNADIGVSLASLRVVERASGR